MKRRGEGGRGLQGDELYEEKGGGRKRFTR